MHVVLANVTNGGLSGGSQKYLEKMCPLILGDERIGRLDVYVPPDFVGSLGRRLGIAARSWPRNDVWRGFSQLRREIRELRPDVVLIPAARWLDCGEIPTVVMVRNEEPLIWSYGGNPWTEMLRNLLRAQAARRACRRATRVIAVSRFMRDSLVAEWRVPRDNVSVIYHGAESAATPSAIQPPASLEASTSEAFLFTAGSIRPNRGLEDAINALALLHAAGSRIKLTIAGATTPGMESYERRMVGLAARLGLNRHVLWLGQLNAGQMAWCFTNAAAFLMTSRAEACPNTVLEAMHYGCLSVSTDQQPMPELYGPAAYYYRAGNAESLARALKIALTASTAINEQMTTAARRRGQQFSWARTAQETISQLAQVAAQRGFCKRTAA